MKHVQDIKQFLIEEFLPDVSLSELDSDYDLQAGGVIDSLGLLKLLAWIEQRYDLSIGDTAVEPDDFRSIAAISSFIESEVGRQRENA